MAHDGCPAPSGSGRRLRVVPRPSEAWPLARHSAVRTKRWLQSAARQLQKTKLGQAKLRWDPDWGGGWAPPSRWVPPTDAAPAGGSSWRGLL